MTLVASASAEMAQPSLPSAEAAAGVVELEPIGLLVRVTLGHESGCVKPYTNISVASANVTVTAGDKRRRLVEADPAGIVEVGPASASILVEVDPASASGNEVEDEPAIESDDFA